MPWLSWIRGGPQDAQSLQNKARQLIGAKRYKKALECLNKLIELRPDFAGGYYNRAVVHILEGRFESALPDCDMAVKRDPKFAQVYVIRSIVHRQLGNPAQADEDEHRARSLDKDQTDNWLRSFNQLVTRFVPRIE